jgi:hypothetical protein
MHYPEEGKMGVGYYEDGVLCVVGLERHARYLVEMRWSTRK